MKRLALFILTLSVASISYGQAALQNLANGFSVDKSYQMNDLDQISTFNGGLNINIPLGQRYVASSALSYQFMLSYGGNTWTYDWTFDYWQDCVSDPTICTTRQIVVEHTLPGPQSERGVSHAGNAGFGWHLSLGRMEGPWTYVSPDGSRHEFREFLHANVTAEKTAGVFYSRDSTYLRRTVVDGLIQVEFPDGARHRFEETSTAHYRLKTMLDRFGNEVTVTYNSDDPKCATDARHCSVDDWTVTDGSRTHSVDMMKLAEKIGTESFSYEVVKSLTLATASGSSTYTFAYDGADTTAGEALSGISRRVAKNQDCRFSPVVLIPILESLTLPDGSQFVISTDRGDVAKNADGTWKGSFSSPTGDGGGHPHQVCSTSQTVAVHQSFSGHVTAVRRPTGATTSWAMQRIDFPPLVLTVQPEECPPDTRCPKTHQLDRDTVGVAERIDRGRDNTLLSRRAYQHTLLTGNAKMSITTFDGFASGTGTAVSTSVHYSRTPFAGTDVPEEYGLPFIRDSTLGSPDAAGHFLSTRLYGGSETGTLLRSTFVKYESDAATNAQQDPSSENRRLQAERTVHYGANNAVSRDVTTTYTDFDGLGHYRVVTTGSTAIGGVPARSRTTTTLYNKPDAQTGGTIHDSGTHPGSYAPFPSADPWVLGTYTSQKVTEGDISGKTLSSFDSATGFLARRRILAKTTGAPPAAAANDVIAVFGHTAGNVTSEEYYGGDAQSLSLESLASLTLPASPVTSLTHTYAHGALATTKYSSVGFNSADRTIAAATGLASSIADTAGVSTSFEYDWAGRMIWSIPTGGSATQYTFARATEQGEPKINVPASVTVRQRAGGKTATVLITASVEYDDLGRVTKEVRTMPGGTESSRTTVYNGRGLVAAASEWGDAAQKTLYTYDAMGRVLSTTAPDESIVSFAYDGIHKVERSVKVASCTDASAATCDTTTTTWSSGATATTIETSDGFGRLFQVEEPGGTVTTYGYDIGDRLVSVSIANGTNPQTRSFSYDGRGFLTSETHPESGTTSYTYDARGHVLTRAAPNATVSFEYDAAERLLQVSDATQTLKQFTYDRSTTDKSMGKLASAKRYNPGTPQGNLAVTETYHYDGNTAGRLSKKETSLAGAQTFTDLYVYDALGAVTSLTYPSCSGCGTLAAPSRTVKSAYTSGFLTSVEKYTAPGQALTYWPNGMLNAVKHLNTGMLYDGPIDTYELDTSKIARPASIKYSGFCNDLSVQELVSKSVTAGSPANLNASASGATTFQWFEVTATGSEMLLDGQTTSQLTVTISSTRRFFVRVGNGTCTVDSNVATVTSDTSCGAPSTAITMASTLTRNQPAQASVAETTGATYQWVVTGGDITSGATASTVHFVTGCDAAIVTVDVSVTPSCSTTPSAGSKSATTSARTTVSLSATSTTIAQGASQAIQVTLTGSAPWTVTWSDDGSSWTGSTSTFERTVSPIGTTTYTASATDANGCSAAGSITITVIPPAPTALTATAGSATSVQLTWTMSGSADAFEIERRAPGAGFVLHHTTATAATSVTLSATANTSYLYRARAVKSGTRSAWSTFDLATTVVFGVDLVPQASVMSASHVTQLRTAVNAVRALWNSGLAPAVFTDADLPGLPAKALHVTEMRNVLNEARAGLGLTAAVYSTTAPVAGQMIRAADLNDLRGGVR